MLMTDRGLAGALKSRVRSELSRPDFLIVGTQKAGTTSLHHYLGRHPRLAPSSGPKELHFFDLYHDRGLGWYLSHFPPRYRREGRLFYETTPDYLVHEGVPGRIRRDLRRVKLVAILREPAERAFSAWRMWHHFGETKPDKASKADPRSFARAIEEELASPDGQADRHFHYVAMGRYAEQLARYRAHFPPEDMLVLDYATMGRDLPGFLGRVSDFLGVERFAQRTVEELGRQRHWASPAAPETGEVRETIARLREYYRPHNARLFDMLGERWAW